MDKSYQISGLRNYLLTDRIGCGCFVPPLSSQLEAGPEPAFGTANLIKFSVLARRFLHPRPAGHSSLPVPGAALCRAFRFFIL
jgi:hypothetical protein